MTPDMSPTRATQMQPAVRESGVASRTRLEKLTLAAFLVLFATVIVVWCDGFTLAQFVSRDAHDYAQMGREIRSGHGFSTLQLFPRHIAYLDQRGLLHSEHIPNLYRYPLPTLANAFFLLFTPDVVRAAVIQTGVCFLLSIPAFFLLAWRLTSPMLAFLCTTLYLANPTFWSFSRSGLTEPLAVLLLLATALTMFAPNAKRIRRLAFLTGALCGLAFLTRSQLAYLYPLSLLFYLTAPQKNDRIYSALLTTAGFILLISPWAIRNMVLTGDPLFSFSSSRSLAFATRLLHSDLDMQLHAPPETAAVLSEYGPAIWKKTLNNFWPGILNPMAWTSSAAFALCIWIVLLGSLVTKGAPETHHARRFKWGCALALMSNFLIMCPTLMERRFNQILHPFIVILTAGYVFLLIETTTRGIGRRITRATIYLAVLLIAATHCAKRFADHRHMPMGRRGLGGICEAIADRSTEHGIVASDISHKISLHCGIPTVRLPGEPEELLEISDKHVPIDHIVFTPRVLKDRPRAMQSFWETYDTYPAFIRTREFVDRYEPLTTLPNGVAIFRRRT